MERYLFLIVLTPCLLPILGLALLAAAALLRTMQDDSRRRKALDSADRGPNPSE